MRIISGKYKGRRLDGFTIDGTRPTMDRVKESIFAIIQNYVRDSVVLDLFSGSGSLGLEAISNGAKKVYLVDNNIISINTIKKNSKDMDNVFIIQKDYQNYLEETNMKYDIIFLDPPYNLHLINNALSIIKEKDLLKQNGLIICEYETELVQELYDVMVKKTYGKTGVIIFKNKEKM